MTLNPYVLLGSAAAWILSLAVVGWLMYARGHDDMRNAYTEQQLAQANGALSADKKKQAVANIAGDQHDQHSTQVNIDTSSIARALQATLGKVEPATDPYVAVWVIRMFDRAASRNVNADPYPGKSDNDASEFRLSQVIAMLSADFGKCETNRVQLADLVAYLKADRTPGAPPASWLDRINPFAAQPAKE